MIISIVGADLDAINQISDLIVDSSCFIKVDMNSIISKIPERCKNPEEKFHWFLNSFDLQKVILKYFETEFSNIVITGNIFLKPEVLQWILKQEGKVIISQSRDISIDDSPEFITFEYKRRYPDLLKSLSCYDKNEQLKLIDLESEDDIQYLDDLITSLQSYKSSNNLSEPEDVLFERIESNMTIEETLKKAMSELGIETEDVPEVPKELTSKPKHKASEVKPVEPVEPVEPVKKQEEPIKQEKPSSVFCKLSGNRMAIMFPVGIELEKRVIGDIELNVLTVPVPNLATTSLQELEVYQPKKETSVKTPEKTVTKKPETFNSELVGDKGFKEKPEKPKRKPAVVSNDMSLDELQSEKARLDRAIKDARAEKDLELVDKLRKQRRAVRKKINDLK